MLKLFTALPFCVLFFCNAIAQTNPGITNTGFYDDFASTQPYTDSSGRGIYWWGTNNPNSTSQIHVNRADSGLIVNLSLREADWTPIGVSFGETFNENPNTINLADTVKVKMVISNHSKYDLKVKLGLIDITNRISEHYPTVITNPAQPWESEIFFVIGSGEKREVVKDATGALGYDYINGQVIYPDLSQIKTMIVTCVNNKLDSITYQPIGIENAQIKIHSVQVGDLPDGEKDELLNTVEIIDTVIVQNPIDTTPVVQPNIPLLNTPGLSEFGLFYQPGVSGLHWFNFNSQDGSSSSFTEDSTKLNIQFNKAKGNYDPMGITFGIDSLGNDKTVNLLYAAKMEISMFNPSDVDYKVWFGMTDIHGKTAFYLSSVDSDFSSNFWQHESAYILSPGESTTLKMDLTNLRGYDFMSMQVEKIDLSKIRSFNITLVNKAMDPEDNYFPFPIDSAALQINYLKVGNLELNELSQSNVLRLHVYSDLIAKFGCTDLSADNFDPMANKDNGSCYYSTVPVVVMGCNTPSALNYNQFATNDNGSCLFEQKTVENIPALVKAGLDKRTFVEVDEIANNCEIDFSKIIDSVRIATIQNINTTQLQIEWVVFQKGKEIIVTSMLEKSEIEPGDIVKQTVTCTNGTMRVTAGQGVELVAEVQESQIVLGTSTNLNEQKTSITFYPNPVTDRLSVNISGKVEVYSMSGIKIFDQKVEKGQQLDVSDWSQGLYLIRVISEEGTITSSIVKQ